MTVKEVLEITINILNQVNVPVGLIQQIGEPIANAIGNLTACVEGMEKAEGAKDGNEADPD